MERDPVATRPAVVVQLPLVDWRPRLGTAGGQVRWRDLTFQRTVNGGDFNGEPTSFLRVVFDTVAFDNGGFSSSIYYPDSGGWWLGTDITNGANSLWLAGLRDHLAWRGCTGATTGPEGHLVLGCFFTGLSGFNYSTKSPSGAIIAFNKLMSTSLFLSLYLIQTENIAVVQNTIEVTPSTATDVLQIIGATDLSHICIWHNTLTGFFSAGRTNLFYDEGAGCQTRLTSTRGNIHCQLNEKNDVFALNGALTGNFPYEHGTGCFGEFSQFIDANGTGIGGSFAQDYPGLGADLGTSASVRNDPLFTNYQGVTSGPTSGAGGGDYTLLPGTPCKDMLAKTCLKWDSNGTVRGTDKTAAGAYEAA